LIGRDHEEDVIGRLLGGVHDQGAVLLVHGEAGVGKSALMAAVADVAKDRGMLVLRATGVQSEMSLSFAALHQLLRPVLAQASVLPSMQGDALLTAFGMRGSTAPDLFLVALAVLELLSEVADSTPVLLVADDAQWLDQSSADVLAFVARRVEHDRIVLVASIRDGFDSPLAAAGLPALRLGGLADRPARELLDANFPDLASAVRERLLAEAAGNPLALLELPAALDTSARTGEAALPAQLPLTARLEHAFAARTAGLPATSRALLQVMAADDSSELTEIVRATGIIIGGSVSDEDLDAAVKARLIKIDGPALRFSHPLVRSAVYQAASVATRHAAHAALAEILAGDPDRRAWHRAAAVLGRDPAVAAELEEAASRARSRGDLMTAARGYERAAALDDDSRHRGALLLKAAEVAIDLGRSEMVRRLLHEADRLPLGLLERARSMWLGRAFRGGSATDPAPVHTLAETAGAVMAAGDTDLALNLLATAARDCYWGNLSGEPVAAVLDAADQTGAAPDDPRVLYIQANAAPLGRGAIVLGCLGRLDPPDDPGSLLLLASAANVTGAFDLAHTWYGAAAAKLRDRGRLGVLAQVLAIQSWSAIVVADFTVALTTAEEGARLAAETGQPLSEMQAWTAQANVAALRGDHAAAEEFARRVERAAMPLGAASSMSLVQYARGMSALGQGRNEEAYDHLRRVHEPGDPAYHDLFANIDFGEFTEAAVRSGHRHEARSLLPGVESVAARTPSPWLDAVLAFARALLASDERAEDAFKEAAENKNMAKWPFLRARLQLAFGEWLRRQRRNAESRAYLRAARDAFDALGTVPWGDRARSELRAAGEASQQRSRRTLDVLTAQELQIVQLVAEGLSNREIGQKLYLSRRTVESHLYRAYPKLGITSRAQLPRVVSEWEQRTS
jgi:DNA-binding CsgD family transcriptional regulator